MKLCLSIICMVGLASPVLAQTMSEEEFAVLAKQKSMQLGKQLKQSLQQAVKSKGLANGVNVCKEIAPVIATSLSDNGWQVGRTALKVRNPNNSPDQWEQQTMEAMLVALAKGATPQTLTTVFHDKSDDSYRYMQPIMTGNLCVNCHGSKLKSSVELELTDHYPEDKATGFEVGDLRGAFTVTYKAP